MNKSKLKELVKEYAEVEGLDLTEKDIQEKVNELSLEVGQFEHEEGYSPDECDVYEWLENC